MKSINFRGGVATLAAGTAISQAITVTAMIVLTRLYSPDDFSALALFSSSLALLSIVINGRLELAIPIAETDRQALDLVWLCIVISLILSAILALTLFAVNTMHLLPAGLNQNATWLVLPIGVLIVGLYKPLQYWHIRKKAYKLIAKVRIFQSSGAVTTQLLASLTSFSQIGLVAGDIFQRGAGFFGMIARLLQHSKQINYVPKLRNILAALRSNNNYPKYSVLEGLANSAGSNIPIIIISTTTSGGEAGFFLLAFRLLAAPLNLMGGALSQVYLAEGRSSLLEGQLYSSTINSVKTLSLICIIPGVCVMAMGPRLLPVIFGDEWLRAGEILALLCPWFFFQLLVSPVSMAVHLLGRQRTALFFQGFGLVLRVAPVAVAAVWGSGFMVEIFCGASAIFYSIYLYSVLYLLKCETMASTESLK